MDKNSVIGFILIGVIFFGFTFWQSGQYRKQMKYQAELDSIARVEAMAQARLDSIEFARLDSIRKASGDTLTLAEAGTPVQIAAPEKHVYKDSLLDAASGVEGEVVILENEKIVLEFTTKGAQPLSAMLKDYRNYDSTKTYLFTRGNSEIGIQVYTGENINTKDFVFTLAEKTDSSVVFRLPFAGGGCIEQRYVLQPDSYMVRNELAFLGMGSVIPKNVSAIDMDFKVTIPRMEKGYKNEVQYSKTDVMFNGDKKPTEVGRGRNASKRLDSQVGWFAFQQQFFSAIFRAKDNFSSGQIGVEYVPEDDPSHNLMTCSSTMRVDYKGGDSVVLPFEMYFGPNHYRTLKSYGQKYEKIIPLGGWLVGWFTKYVIINLFDFLHRFISNFGIIILLMTIFIKIVVLPFAYKTYSSSAKMQAIKPWVEKLNAKYPKPEDAMKKQQATMELYQRAGINPMGGCLPMLLQFPILWAMFRFFPASIELRQQSFLWAEDLSAYDSIVNFGTKVPLLGDHLSLFALLMAVSMFFYTQITMKGQAGGDDPNAKMMKFMSTWMMPFMMFFICNNLSSGLSYYYLLSNLITMAETWVIQKFFVDKDAVRKKLEATEGKKPQKSKWQLRLEEAQRMQQQMAKEQANKNRR